MAISMERQERWRRGGAGAALGAIVGFLSRDLDLTTVLSYTGDRTPLIVVAALAGALLGLTSLRWLLGVAAGGLSLIWATAAFSPLALALSRDLPRRDPLRPADGVFVLSSNLQTDGELTSSAMSRLLHGLELLGEGWAPRLVLSELALRPYYAAAARPLMKRLGMAQELYAVGPVFNTREEALAVSALFRERGWRTIILVTSPTHSRRAAAAFEHEGLTVVSSPSVETRFDLETLDEASDRLAAFGSVLHERVGLWVYARRGWLKP